MQVFDADPEIFKSINKMECAMLFIRKVKIELRTRKLWQIFQVKVGASGIKCSKIPVVFLFEAPNKDNSD